MTPLVFNYQVGNPNATYPASLTVKSSDAGVSINTLAPTHRYIAFGLASTPPLPPSLGYLLWTPTTEVLPGWTPLVFEGTTYANYTFEQFQAVDPTNVSAILLQNEDELIPLKITSVSNFIPYTNLTFIYIGNIFLSDVNFEDMTLVPNETIPAPMSVIATSTASLTAVNNLPKNAQQYDFGSNNLPTSSVENILIELVNMGAVDGYLNLSSGNNDKFSTEAGSSAYNTLISRGWTANVNAERLPILATSDDSVTSIYSYMYNGSNFTSFSVDSFNPNIDGDYEGVTELVFNNYIITSNLTSINNLNTYVNLTVLSIAGFSNLTSLDITYLQALESVSIAANAQLTSINIAPYYKNLTFVNFAANALGQPYINGILIALDNNGKANGEVQLQGGTNEAPSAEGVTAKNNLIAKGWYIQTN